MLKEIYQDAEGRMQGAVQALEEDLAGIRTGRANPALVERLQIEYYGMPTNLIQLATISVPEPRSLADPSLRCQHLESDRTMPSWHPTWA